jgi:3-hydroxyisobutyrate dehydrogenase-like beta-hydroxyacid dehydrogenase
MKKKLGFIGLGVMGANMCQRILESGKFDLTVFDIDPAKVARAVELGAAAASSLGALAAENKLIACSLPNPDSVKKVFLASDAVVDHVQPGTVILDLSTVDSDTSKEVSRVLEGKGATYIDTPVSGGKYDSLKGTLTLIIGAREDELAEHRDLLEVLSQSIHFAGTRGAGSTIKLVNNVMSMGNLLVAAEAFVLGVKAGVDGGTLFDIIQHCGGRSHRLTKRFPNILRGDFEPKFTVDLAEKDLTLALDLARKLKVPMLMAGLTHDFFLMTSKSGWGGSDATSVIQYLEKLNDVEVRGEPHPDSRYI